MRQRRRFIPIRKQRIHRLPRLTKRYPVGYSLLQMSRATLASRLRALSLATPVLLLAGCGSSFMPDSPGGIRPAKSQFTDTHPHDFPLHGIDVSKYQGDIEWDSVKQSGIAFAYIKATEGGNHIDPKFRQNWEAARAAGLPRGAYHFVWWCRPPLEEIAWFEQNVPVEPDALPPVLDVEATPTSQTCKRHLDRAGALAVMRVMLAEMERHYGKRPVIYTTVDFYEAILSPDELNDYPIWIRSTKYSPNVKYGSRRWHFWQYQSDGVVPGIRTNVDRNAFHGDSRAWMAFAAGISPESGRPIVAVDPVSTASTTISPVPLQTTVPAAVQAAEAPTAVPAQQAPLALMPPASMGTFPRP